MGPTLELKLTHSGHVAHGEQLKMRQVSRIMFTASKNVQILNVSKFEVVARFRETIPMVKSVSSSEI